MKVFTVVMAGLLAIDIVGKLVTLGTGASWQRTSAGLAWDVGLNGVLFCCAVAVLVADEK